MNDLMLNASRWLWDYFLLASVLLLVVTIVAKLIGQPARRMAIHWSTAASLVLLALLCCVPGWSVVHMLSAPAEPPIPSQDFEPVLSPAIQLALAPAQLPPTNPAPALDISLMDLDNAPTPKPAPAVVTVIDFGMLSFYAFIAGAFVCLLWLFVGYLQLRHIRSKAIAAPDQLVNLLNQLAAGQQTPHLGIATKLPVAAAVGLFRPMILLPLVMLPRNSAEQTSAHELRSVLAHELAHIRHRDLWLLAIMRSLQLLLWPHPLYWLWRRNVRLDQETLADAAAADVTDRTDYAERLVAWARVATEMRPPRLASSVGLWENPSQLKRRIAILLDEKLNVLRSCSLRWKFSSALLLVVLAGGLSLVTLQPDSSIAAKPSETTLSEAKHQGRVKKIADGVIVELLAIGTNARDEDIRWWDADGKTVETLPFEVLTSTNIRPLPNRQLVFRVHDLPGDADVRWRTEPASNSSSGTIVLDGMKRPYGYYSHEFERPRQGDTFSLRVGVAVGDWATIASGISGAQSMFRKGVVFSDALSDRDGNTVVIVSHSYSDADTRGLAIDDKGNEWISNSRRGSSAGEQNQSQWTFVGLKPDKVKSFGLQIRQYQWVEFEDLPADVTKRAEREVMPASQPAKNAAKDTPKWTLQIATSPSDSDAVAESQDTLTIATTPAESDNDEIQSLDLRAGPVTPADRDIADAAAVEMDEASQPKQSDSQDLAKVMRPLHQQLEAKRRPNTILGICVNEQGEPVADVDVQVYSQRAGFLNSQPPTSIAKTKSNRQGVFRFDKVIDIEKVYPDGIPGIHTPSRNQQFYTSVGRVNGRVPGRSSELAAPLAKRGQVVVWVMQEAKTLRGRITDTVGNPIANATVKAGVSALLMGQNDLQLGIATTNNNGEYAIDHLPAYDAASAARQRAEMIKKNPILAQTMSSEPSQQLLVTHPDFAAKRVEIRSIPGETNAQLRPGSTIEGRVTFPPEDKPDAPVSGIVYLQRDMPEQKLGELTAPFSLQVQSVAIQPDGRYRFESLPDGTYHLSAKVAGYVTNGIENVVAPAGKTTTAANIKFTRGGLVRLQLLDDKTGEPLQLDDITPGWVNPQRVPREQVFPGTNNVVMFSPQATGETHLAPGKYRLHVNIPNDDGSGALIASKYLDIKSPEDLKNLPTIEIQDDETIDMRVKMRRWNPTDRATTGAVQAAATPSDSNSKDNDASEESTDDEDVIFFKVQQTVPSDLDSSKASERSDETINNRVTVTQADPEIIRQVEFPWVVRGRVTDAEGNGLANVEVRAATGVGTLLGGGRTKTDDEGRYLLRFGPGMRTNVSEHAPLGVGVQAASIYASKPGWSEENLCRHGDLLMTDLTPETLGENAKRWGNKSADDVVFADQPKTVNFVMQPAVVLEGEFVESSRNWEVEDQSISITGPDLPPSSSVLTSLKTDDDGKFRVENLPIDHEWRFTMRVTKTAIDLESKPFRFDKPGRYRCRLVLEANPSSDSTTLALRVKDLQRIDP